MGEANFYYFTCLKFYNFYKLKKRKNAESRGERKRKEGRKEGGAAADRRSEELREEAQEFRNRSRHTAQARFDPLRQMAQVHRPPEAEGRPSTTSQGPTSHQPVLDDVGPTHRHPGVQVVGQVPP